MFPPVESLNDLPPLPVEEVPFALDILPLPTDQTTDGSTSTSLGTLNLLLTASARAVNAALVATNIQQHTSVSVTRLLWYT